jgi:hypothetical protein
LVKITSLHKGFVEKECERGLSLKRVLDMKVCKRGHNSKGRGLSYYDATFVFNGKISQKYIIRSEVIL